MSHHLPQARARAPRAIAFAAALVLACAAAALASPPPRLRAGAGAGVLAPPAAAAPVGEPGGACGTRLEAVLDALAASAAREPAAALPTSHSTDAGGIAVLEDDGSFFYTNKDNRRLVDIAAVGRAFYRTHGDDYDVLAVYLASGLPEWLGSPGALAACWVVRNDTQGIGLETFDLGEAVGSASRLQELLTMNSLSIYPADPDQVVAAGDVFTTMGVLAHEFAHRWLAYTWIDSAGTASTALLGRDLQHWSFFADVDSSYMEGCDWTALAPDSFVTTGSVSTFGALDQYLMGLRAREEMAPFFTLAAPEAFDPPGNYWPNSVPWLGIGCRARQVWWTLDDLDRRNGPRLPVASASPHHWRVATALLVPNGSAAADSDLAKLQAIRARFPGVIAAATGQRGSVDLSLDSRAGRVRLAHAPLPDREDTGAPVELGVRAWIEQAGLPLVLDPASVTLHWRTGTSGPFADVTLAGAGADSFGVSLPPPGSAATFQYWFSAASDSAGIASALPDSGAAAPFTFHIGPDLEPPVVRHVAVPFQSADRMPQTLLARVTDNAGVDSVWLEVSADGGAPVAFPAVRAGADSFTVDLAAGGAHALAYRFVARDVSAAGNLAASNPAFDTLRVSRDAFDDFENPARNWGHAPVLWSGRDVWAPGTLESSPAGGTAWHCGSTDGTPYPPHVDAALYTPWNYGIVPGTVFVFDERHDLEDGPGGIAYDAARVEVQPDGGAWTPAEPLPGYTHAAAGGSFLPGGAGCWSGDSHGWVTRVLDLSPWAPGPVRVRVRMSSDEFVGRGGVWVDRARVHYPGGGSAGVDGGPRAGEAGPAWPNPARDGLSVRLALARAARVEWALHDLQGRRVATLWSGPLPAGTHVLEGATTAVRAAGLYFSRIRVDGRALPSRRVAIVR